MILTYEQLVAIMPGAKITARPFVEWLNQFMPIYEIAGVRRCAAFLATIAEESGEFVYTREIWGPTDAQKGYEYRADLGNTKFGDGKMFKGRGLIQITGRANYQAASDALGVGYVNNPEMMSTVPEATRTACWWWHEHGCNELADIPDFEAVTRRVNGGLTHFDRRKAYYDRALVALKTEGVEQ